MKSLNINFYHQTFKDYTQLQRKNRILWRKANQLIIETSRNPFKGIDKPEPLKHDPLNRWSKRISHQDRIVYSVQYDCIQISQIEYHY